MKGKPQGGRAPRAEADHTTYKSPQRKLVKFFQRSRDQWKAKCRGAKAEVKTHGSLKFGATSENCGKLSA